jgi:hypothetical protein
MTTSEWWWLYDVKRAQFSPDGMTLTEVEQLYEWTYGESGDDSNAGHS